MWQLILIALITLIIEGVCIRFWGFKPLVASLGVWISWAGIVAVCILFYMVTFGFGLALMEKPLVLTVIAVVALLVAWLLSLGMKVPLWHTLVISLVPVIMFFLVLFGDLGIRKLSDAVLKRRAEPFQVILDGNVAGVSQLASSLSSKDLNRPVVWNDSKQFPIFMAAQYADGTPNRDAIALEMVNILKNAGADINNPEDLPLSRAALYENIPAMQILLKAGADINAANGMALQETASAYGSMEAFQYLLDHGARIDMRDSLGNTALFYAAERGRTSKVQLILKKWKDIPQQDKDLAFMIALKEKQMEVASLLLAAGANVNVADQDGVTPLMYAVRGNEASMVLLLLNAGADVNATDKKGNSALNYFANYVSTEILDQLLAAGAKLSNRPANSAVLLEKSVEGGNADLVRQLLAVGANVNAKDKGVWTFLMTASEKGHTEVVRQLLSAGANVNAQSRKGTTALMSAAAAGHTDIVRQLLSAGANVNAQSEYGTTALIYAVRKGHTEIIHQLLAAGADVNAKDKNGKTALIHARDAGYKEIVQLLQSFGAKE